MWQLFFQVEFSEYIKTGKLFLCIQESLKSLSARQKEKLRKFLNQEKSERTIKVQAEIDIDTKETYITMTAEEWHKALDKAKMRKVRMGSISEHTIVEPQEGEAASKEVPVQWFSCIFYLSFGSKNYLYFFNFSNW